jgi:NAD(P)-dependent dehydrogenase (short-subunit alcohol dehydrogenase family)
MEKEMQGKVALVTGASQGIGRSTAIGFAERGAKVSVADIDEEGASETVRMIEDAGGDAVFLRTDVSDEKAVKEMVRQTVDRFGGLDYAVNNAGIEGDLAPTAEYGKEAWDRVIGINLTGVWLCMKYEIPELLERGGGSVVNIASILGHVSFANTPAYSASKHGVVGLTKAAALDYATKGIRVNAVCPGFIDTPMVMQRGLQAGSNPEVKKQLEDAHPVQRLGQPAEIASAILWLCSDGAKFTTGQSIIVDGGYTAQ